MNLQSGDVILRVGDTEVSKPADVMRALRDWEPGSGIELHIMRERKEETIEVELPEHSFGFTDSPVAEFHYFDLTSGKD